VRAQKVSGIFNIGSGKARSFNDLVHATFKAMNKPAQIEYIPMPENLRSQYQYFTEAPMQKLQKQCPQIECMSLEASVEKYVQGYLMSECAYTDVKILR